MKFKRLFLCVGLAFVAGGSALFCANSVASKSAVEVKADSTVANTTIYLEVCDNWLDYNAVPRLYVSPAASSWLAPNATIKQKDTTIGQHALYSFNLPAGVTSFFIYRMDPDHPNDTSGIWNATQSVSYSTSHNYYNVTSLNGQDCPYTPGWMNVFQRYYANHQDFEVTIINEDYNWFDSSATTWIRFWDGTEIKFDRVISYYQSAIYTNTLKCSTYSSTTAPAIYATGFNIFRKSSDGSKTWSQTGNWAFTYGNKDMNAFVIKAKNGDAQFYDGEGQSKVIGDEYNAMAYGIFFLETTKSICYGKEEGNNLSALSGVWNKLKGAANASTNGTYLLKTEEEIAEFISSNEYYTHDAYLRYSHIVTKYPSLGNFLEITPAASGRIVSSNDIASNSNMLIIIIFGLAAVSVVGLVMLIGKRKKSER